MRLRLTCLVLGLVALGAAGCGSHPTPPASAGLGTVTPAATTAPSAGASPAPSAPSGLSGTLYYLSHDENGGPTVLHGLIGGTVRTLATLPSTAYFTVNVSPDGRLVSWVDDKSHLYVANVDGTGKRDLGQADGVGYCTEPVWSPDSQRLLFWQNSKPYYVGAGGGARSAAPNLRGCHFLWTGTRLSYGDGGGKVFVANADGTGATAIPSLGTGPAGGPRSFDVESLSPDGGQIVLDLHTGDVPDGDAARGLNANTVLDTRTGATVATPPFQQALFLPNGNLLTRNKGTLIVVSPAGQTVLTESEPATAKSWILLGYAPAS
jgi:Tol biopolymer transport system component